MRTGLGALRDFCGFAVEDIDVFLTELYGLEKFFRSFFILFVEKHSYRINLQPREGVVLVVAV